MLCGDGTLTRLVGAVDGDFIARGDGRRGGGSPSFPGTSGGKVAALVPGAAGVYGFLSSWWGAAGALAAGGAAVPPPALLGLGRDPTPAQKGQAQGPPRPQD